MVFQHFRTIIDKVFGRERNTQKTELLLDTAPLHLSESSLKTKDGQIYVHYLSLNETSLIEPKGIFLSFILQHTFIH